MTEEYQCIVSSQIKVIVNVISSQQVSLGGCSKILFLLVSIAPLKFKLLQ